MNRAPQNAAVVTGMGCVCAAGMDCVQAWEGLCAGVQHRVPAGALHPDALPYAFFAVPEAAFPHGRRFSTLDTVCLARHAATQALAQACVPDEALPRMGVVVGTTAGSALHFLEGYQASRTAAAAPRDDIHDYFSGNVAMCLARDTASQGPLLTVANACTSGADAIGIGAALIEQNQCDVVLCGGADALSLVPHTGFARLMIYSAEPCRPFDAERQGLNLGEGAGMLVLESAAYATRRGATPLGRVAGYGAAADAHHFTAPHPQARGLHAAVQKACATAGIDARELAFINAHGTATKENDMVEGTFFMRTLPQVPVWGSKSVTGHTLGAAGALEAVFSLLALHHGEVPPTWGFRTVQPDLGLCPTRQRTPVTGAYALSTSLAFGGGNAALVVAKADA